MKLTTLIDYLQQCRDDFPGNAEQVEVFLDEAEASASPTEGDFIVLSHVFSEGV